MTGSSSKIVFEALPVDDPQVRQPDITRAQQLYGWRRDRSGRGAAPHARLARSGTGRCVSRVRDRCGGPGRRIVGARLRGRSASRFLKTGIFDDAQGALRDTRGSVPAAQDHALTTRQGERLVVRPGHGVVKHKPKRAADPRRAPAYDWTTYDRTVRYAVVNGMQPVFSIIGTPPWANAHRGWNVAPTNARTCGPSRRPWPPATRATTSARRRRPSARRELDRVERAEQPRVHASAVRSFRQQVGDPSAKDYARICNAIVTGVHSVGGGKVACGVTAPRGNNNPNTGRASVSPLAFLRAMKQAGAKGFDAYAHHPYYGTPTETPSTSRPGIGPAPTAITLANFSLLTARPSSGSTATCASGSRSTATNEFPPDRFFGVTYASGGVPERGCRDRARTRGSTCSCGSCSRTKYGPTAGNPA